MNPNVIRCVFRGTIVLASLLLPLGIEEKFLVAGVFSLLWALEPLVRERRRRSEMPAAKGIAVLLSAVIGFEALGFPERNQASEQVIVAVERDREDSLPAGLTPEEWRIKEGRFTVCEFVMVGAIVVIIAGGYVWYYYKSKKVCKKVGGGRARQIENTNPPGWDPDAPATNRVRSVRTEYGAYFFEGYGTPTAEQLADCQCQVLPIIEWVTPGKADGVLPARIYFPTTNLVAFGEWLAGHGLVDESTNTHYSFNGVATANPPAIFQYTNRSLTISADGKFSGNVISVLQRSRNLVAWETLFRASAPPGTTNNYTDGDRPPVGAAFYRVLAE